MNRAKRILKPLFENERGKPRFLKKLLILATNENFVHRWLTSEFREKDVVLDVGANRFPYTKYQKVKAVYGVDIPSDKEGYLGWNKEKLNTLKKFNNIHPVWANAEALPFKDNSFDKVILTEVLEHVEKDEKAVKEITRVLKRKGKLLLTTPNGEEVENKNPYHFRHYKPKELEKILSSSFKKVQIELKFPNHDLFVKQHLPENQNIPIKLFWKYYYEIWYLLLGKKYPGGYTIAATCSNPNKNRVSRETPTNDLNIVVCPVCKGELKEKKIKGNNKALYCKNCDRNYSYQVGIPVFFQKTK